MNAVSLAILFGVAGEALVLGYVMRRKGFDGYIWTLLGLFLGPIALVVAVSFALRPPKRETAILRRGGANAGRLDVLVGFDGSAEATEAVARVHELFGLDVGRVAIATVTPIDAPAADEQAASAALEQVVDLHPDLHAAAVMLHGEPAASLQAYARDAGYQIIVVGARGSGWSKLIGGVASALARDSAVPVVLVDKQPAIVHS